jgi:ABC-type transporter Mla subunit MlaD
MSNPTPSLPARPSLEQLRKRAKELLRSARAADPAAAERFRAADPLIAVFDTTGKQIRDALARP